MTPIEILMQEHRVIERVIDRLAAVADAALEEGRLERQPALDALEFIRDFADGCHHAKEEGHLFALMAERGFSREQGPLAVMLYEHEEGRACVRAMAGTVEAAATGDRAAVEAFAQAAQAYAELLRGHIEKEDGILYPMAERALTPADQEALATRFAAQEATDQATGAPQRCLALAEELSSGAVPAMAAGGNGTGCCVCGHHGDQ
jgi:hemerythrin-like domain-containing protein